VPSLRERAYSKLTEVYVREFKQGSTTRARLIWWTATSDMFADRPLTGWGVGSYGSVYYRFAPPQADQSRYTAFVQATHPHNEFLRLLAELGIVGLGLYVALLAAAFVVSYRAIRRQDWGVQTVGFALWSGGLAYLVHVALGKEVMSWDFALGYWMLIGTLASTSLWKQRPAETAGRPFAMTWRSWAALALTTGLLVCGWWHWGLGGYRSMIYLKDARIRGEIIPRAKEPLRRAEQMRDFLAKAEPRSLWPTEILRYRHTLGASFFLLKRYVEAAEQFELIEHAAPGFTDVELQLGNCYLMLDQREKAREALESFVQKHPSVTEGYENLARTDLGRALELLLKQVAAERFADERRVALAGAILAELGQWDAVEQLLSETQKHEAQSSLKRLVRTLDRACERLGMKEKAEGLRKRFPSAFEEKGSTGSTGE
jgi:hypothetical protein